mgnify:CR=1 FL=1
MTVFDSHIKAAEKDFACWLSDRRFDRRLNLAISCLQWRWVLKRLKHFVERNYKIAKPQVRKYER